MTANAQTLDTMPWYKYPWPWFFLAIPALTVVAGFYTFFLASTSFDGMVEDDYYKRGLAINQDIARDHKAADLGLTAEAMIGRGEVRVFLNAKGDIPHPDYLLMRFRHATRAGMDQSIELHYEGGFYSGSIEQLYPGKWRLALEDTDEVWRLLSNFDPDKHESVRLLPLPVLAASMAPADD
ncbi:MAG: FixH family protein [Betaproteobacteria bacterium]|nr:FixH family protein [Betaproteobacteria bacterium]